MSTDDRVLLAQISDLHIGADAAAPARAAAAVTAIAALDPAPDAVLVTGDLTEHGAPAEYAQVRELLAPLRIPHYVLPGNHDDRKLLRTALGPPIDGDAPAPFVQYTARCGHLRLVVCDTTEP